MKKNYKKAEREAKHEYMLRMTGKRVRPANIILQDEPNTLTYQAQKRRDKKIAKIKAGLEENDLCLMSGCDGIMVLPDNEACTCHIAPPCHYCVNIKMICSVCYRNEEEMLEDLS